MVNTRRPPTVAAAPTSAKPPLLIGSDRDAREAFGPYHGLEAFVRNRVPAPVICAMPEGWAEAERSPLDDIAEGARAAAAAALVARPPDTITDRQVELIEQIRERLAAAPAPRLAPAQPTRIVVASEGDD